VTIDVKGFLEALLKKKDMKKLDLMKINSEPPKQIFDNAQDTNVLKDLDDSRDASDI